VPRLAGLLTTFRGMTFNWRRVLVKEYQKPFDWLVLLAVVTVVKIALDGALQRHAWTVGLMLAVMAARITLYFAGRAVGARDQLASAGR
jgi:CDP-diglyceride synthetase